MYLIGIDHLTYAKRDGSSFTLAEALRETNGVGNARILRTDGTVVVLRAGNRAMVHAPSGRTIFRDRPARHIVRNVAA